MTRRARQPSKRAIRVRADRRPSSTDFRSNAKLDALRQLGSNASSAASDVVPAIVSYSQACPIGYLARILPMRFKALSAASCGVMFSRMTLACAEPQICAALTSDMPGL